MKLFAAAFAALALLPLHARAQSATYTFDTPSFTLGEVTPLLNRAPNLGDGLLASFTSSPTAGGYQVGTFLQAPLSGPALLDQGTPDALTISFTQAIHEASFAAVITVPALGPAGRVTVQWDGGSQDFQTGPMLPGNFQVAEPTLSFPTPVTAFTVSAFDSGGTQVRLFLDTLAVTAVPEPATWAFLGLAVTGGLAAWRYRRCTRRTQLEAALPEDSPLGE